MNGSLSRDLVAALGDVTASLKNHSLRLRQRVDVTSVERRCEITGGERPAVEWYVDAELGTGDALTWRLLLYWSGAEWVIEADIRRVAIGGSHAEVEFDRRVSHDATLGKELLAAADDLTSAAVLAE